MAELKGPRGGSDAAALIERTAKGMVVDPPAFLF